MMIRKVRHSVLNASISTEVAISFFTSSAMASSVAQPSVSYFFLLTMFDLFNKSIFLQAISFEQLSITLCMT